MKKITQFSLFFILFISLFQVDAQSFTQFRGLGADDSAEPGFKTISTNSVLVVSNNATGTTGATVGSELFSKLTTAGGTDVITLKADGVNAVSFDVNDLSIFNYLDPASDADYTTNTKIVFKDAVGTTIRTMTLNSTKSLTSSMSGVSIGDFFDNNASLPVTGVSEIEITINPSTVSVDAFTIENITLSNIVSGAVPSGPATLDFNTLGITNTISNTLGKSTAIGPLNFEINAPNENDLITYKANEGAEGSGALYDNNADIGGITKWTISRHDGSEFTLSSIYLQDAGFASTEGTLKARRNGTQVGSTVDVNFNGNIDVSGNPDFMNIDEIWIEATDINFYLDNVAYVIPSSVVMPTVTTSFASSLTATGATLNGEVTSDGGDMVTEHGFVYATSSNPTTSDTKVQVGSGTGSFSEAITGLTAETTYYVRAYAINGEGTSYGSEVSFTTSALALIPLQSLYWPNETNDKIEGISLTGSSRQDIVTIANSGAIIAVDIDHVNEKVYWFDQNDSKIYRANLNGTASEEFISNPGYATTIFVDHVNEYLYWPNYEGSKIERIKLDGTGREDVIIATDPIGISVDVSNSKVYWFDQTNESIYRGNLDGSGSEEFISNPGYATTVYIDQKNNYLYWPNYEGSKIERIKLDGTGREDVISATDPIGISVDVSGSKVYWYDQTNGSIYRGNLDGSGSEEFISDPGYATTLSIPWEMPANSAPTVVTSLVSSITATGATLSGNVTDDGEDTVTERGFVYSLTADDSTPTVAESSGADVTKVVVSGTTSTFDEAISGLSASSQYSFAAYAINSVGTSYGLVEQFSTVNNPITEYSSGTNTLPDTRFFGVQFTTPNTDPAYSMTGFTFLDNTGSTPTGAGKVYVFTSSPSGLLTPSDLPTYTDDLLGVSDTWNGSVYGFSRGLNLDANTTYWILTDTDGFEVGNDFSNPNNAIYATGSGNNYVNQLQTINFQVSGIAVSAPPTVTTTAISAFDATSATMGGNVTDDGGATVNERGIVYNTTGTPTTADTKVQIGSGNGVFSDEIIGLTAGTTYYVRAYAINSEGTSYGSEESFITSTLGLEDDYLKNAIGLYPNPVNDVLHLATNTIKVESLVLFDVLGKRIDTIKMENNAIDISNLESGIYLLKIETESGNVIKRIVKK